MPANIYRATVTGLSSNASGGAQTNSSGFPTFFPDLCRTPFNIGVGVTVNSTAVLWNCEFSFDYIGALSSNFVGFLSSLATWFQHSTLSGQSSNASGNFAFGVTAIRGNVTAGSSTGLTNFTFVQSG